MVCKTAPIPGETKVWQYITLTRRIYLIDCPGIVPPNPNDTDEDLVLRSVVRIENVEDPSQYVAALLSRCQPKHIARTYGLTGWTDSDDFLEQLARKMGKLLKGGDADANGVAKSCLNDYMRGKLPWYIGPPRSTEDGKPLKIEGRSGALGEQNVGGKRKWEEANPNAEKTEKGADAGADDLEDDGDSDDGSENDLNDNNDNEKEEDDQEPDDVGDDDDSVAASEDSFLDDSETEAG
jgi:nuclear GTP-binding protein